MAALETPGALVSLIEPHRQFLLSSYGLPAPWATLREKPLSHSLCQHLVWNAEPLVVDDAREHALLRDSRAIDELGVVAYLGVPLVSSDGHVLGSLCVFDSKPRRWRERDVEVLRALAASVLTEMEVQAAGRAVRRGRPRATEPAGLNIAALAKRTGVGADTLRKWEQRYGILRPSRTTGGQRRYDEADVSRVEWLRARLAEGYRIREAAALLGESEGAIGERPEQIRAAVFSALAAGDSGAVDRLLDHAFALANVETTLVEVVQPLLEQVGEAWETGALTVAHEHLVTGAVRARLDRLLADARGGSRGAAVLACAPGERHELGLLMLAILLRADGWHVAYLGADTPFEDALALTDALGARLLCVSAARDEPLEELERALARAEVPRDVDIVVGGAAATPERVRAAGARYAEHDLRRAVRRLRRLAA